MSKLKPCPFCGRSHGLLITSIHHRFDDITHEQWSVFCDASGDKVGCGASCGYHRTKAEAIEAWNRRAYIEPERKTGKWIDNKSWWIVYHPYKCDQCGEHSESNSNYCPNCGAKMNEGSERG